MTTVESVVRRVKNGLRLPTDSNLVRSLRPAYDALLRSLYAEKGITRSIHGEEPIRLRPQYRACSEDAEPAVFATLKAHARPGAIVLDIGANVGVFSLVLARWVGSGGLVFAFEPAPAALVALHDHIILNEMQDRIQVTGAAISDAPGTAKFYADGASGENTLRPGFVDLIPSATAVSVTVTTIDEFCTAKGIAPGLIKIDIEGFEFHALSGARQTLIKCRPVLVVEFHPQHWKAIGVDPKQAKRLLDEIHYRIVPLEGQSDPLGEFGHVLLAPCG